MMSRTLSPIARRAAERLKGSSKPAEVEVEIDTSGDTDGPALDMIAEDIASGDVKRIKSALRDLKRMCSSDEPDEGEDY